MNENITQISPPKQLATGRLFTVERREYQIGTQEPAIRDVIVHPGAAVVVALLDQTRMVLVWNYRYAVEKEMLELPAGTLEPPEPARQCALRELEEETGYRAGKIRPLGRFYSSPGILSEQMQVFLATDLIKTEPRPNEDEHVRPEIMEISRVIEMIADGRIEDAKTIAGMYLYQLTKDRQLTKERLAKEPQE